MGGTGFSAVLALPASNQHIDPLSICRDPGTPDPRWSRIALDHYRRHAVACHVPVNVLDVRQRINTLVASESFRWFMRSAIGDRLRPKGAQTLRV